MRQQTVYRPYIDSPAAQLASRARSSARRLFWLTLGSFLIFLLHFLGNGDPGMIAVVGAGVVGVPAGVFLWFVLGCLRFAFRR